MKTDMLVLVNERDEAIGEMEKMEVHQKGILHRAISVFIFDQQGRLLMQQRAASKYHGGGLWTNTCCSHPYPGELPEAAASRRLQEEMGFIAPLVHMLSFTYRAEVENGLIENEFDHVFAGTYEGKIRPDENEVADFKYLSMEDLRDELRRHPEKYTQWFRIVFPDVEKWWKDRFTPTA